MRTVKTSIKTLLASLFPIVGALLLLASAPSVAQTPMPKHEVRAVWLTTIGGLDWPHSYSRSASSARAQQKELCGILDKLRAANVNTVLLQTRVRGTVIYPSAFEPWDGCLSGIPGQSPGYDALQFAVEECHKRGMELHAWIVAIPVGGWNAAGCRRLRTTRPALLRKIDDQGYLNPERKETADYLASLCREVASGYDIDGIHLDYIRYPENWQIKVGRTEGRRNITAIVRKVHDAVKSLKPWVKMSCSPVGKHDDLSRYSSRGWNAYARVCQDAQGWLREGLMDELFPMMYFKDNQFYPFALDWLENSCGRIVVPGLGVYMMSPKEKDWDAGVILRELQVLRRMGGVGHAYFRSKFFTDNTKGIYDIVSGEIDAYPALVPPMTWQSDAKPAPPTELKVTHMQDGDLLEWSGAQSLSDCPTLTYNVYAGTSWPVNTDDARCLVAARLGLAQLFVPRTAGRPELNYAVRAMDRYGNESQPVYSQAPTDNMKAFGTQLFVTDGYSLPLQSIFPTFEAENTTGEDKHISNVSMRTDEATGHFGNATRRIAIDAEYIVIEDLQGRIVTTTPYRPSADISRLANGIYVVRTLGLKGVSHRLGWFALCRKPVE